MATELPAVNFVTVESISPWQTQENVWQLNLDTIDLKQPHKSSVQPASLELEVVLHVQTVAVVSISRWRTQKNVSQLNQDTIDLKILHKSSVQPVSLELEVVLHVQTAKEVNIKTQLVDHRV